VQLKTTMTCKIFIGAVSRPTMATAPGITPWQLLALKIFAIKMYFIQIFFFIGLKTKTSWHLAVNICVTTVDRELYQVI